MKRTKTFLALFLTMALFAAMLSGCGSGGTITLTVYNQLGYDIEELYISESASDTWGEPLIYGGLENDYSAELSLTSGKKPLYDIYAMDTDGDNYLFFEVPLKNKAELILDYTTSDLQAVVMQNKGNPVYVVGEFSLGEVGMDKIMQPPTKDDPLDMSMALPGFESVVLSYPSTLKIIASQEGRLSFDAIADDAEIYETIIFSIFSLGGNFEARLNAGSESAKTALGEISTNIQNTMFPNMYLDGLGFDFENEGSYYSAKSYLWLKGEVFNDKPTTPVRGVLECRYYGPTGYVLTMFTLANESEIQRYYEISGLMFDSVSYNAGWHTSDIINSGVQQWSDPGDNGYYYDDDYWYEPNDSGWSDPGDYGYYYDDYWYEPNDAGWSDPGDYGYYY